LETAQECENALTDGRTPLKRLIRRFVELGIHPTDETGVAKIRATPAGQQKKVYREWDELFAVREIPIDWQDATQTTDQSQFNALRRELVNGVLRDLTEVLFSKTYFALEESGLGYPCVERGVLRRYHS
jgi:DEAD/DEAH box helicase domain-containing protein